MKVYKRTVEDAGHYGISDGVSFSRLCHSERSEESIDDFKRSFVSLRMTGGRGQCLQRKLAMERSEICAPPANPQKNLFKRFGRELEGNLSSKGFPLFFFPYYYLSPDLESVFTLWADDRVATL